MKELSELVHELRTQDNAATAHPLFVVQERRRISGMDPQFDHLDFEWHNEDHEHRYSEDEIQEVIREEIALEYDEDLQDVEVEERDPENYGYERVYYIDVWEFVCAHFTRKAAQRYINENVHNLTSPRVYVTSQYRCPEWIAIVEYLEELDK